MKTDFKNKVVVITGGSGGIGSETAKMFHQNGAKVVIISRNPNKQNLNKKIQDDNIFYLAYDLQKAESWQKALKQILGKFKRIDILINCLGILIPGSLEKLNQSAVLRMIDTNIRSIIISTKKVLAIMSKQESGIIINIGSLGGIVPMPHESVYCATKFALRGFTLSLAEELRGSNIDICLISPGPVKTNLLDTEAKDDYSTITFINDPIEPKKVARVIVKASLKPKREIILPGSMSFGSKLIGAFPGIFTLLFPIVNVLGSKKLMNYKKEYSIVS